MREMISIKNISLRDTLCSGIFVCLTAYLILASPIIAASNSDEIKQEHEREWIMTSAAPGRSFAIRYDGSLWGWGNNLIGLPEDDVTTSHRTPVQVMNDVAAVSAGRNHTMAIRTDGSLWVWGLNDSGQLGDGTTISHLTPIQIMEDVIAISSGFSHSMAVKSDGSLWAWGLNDSGQLGDGTTIDRHSPVKIMENTVFVSAGTGHSAAITKDGTLWTWGENHSGQLGDGSTTQRKNPIEIMSNVTAVSLGSGHTMAIQVDGGLWAWGGLEIRWQGAILSSIMGDADRRYPVRVMEDVASVSTGHSHIMVIKTDGSLWAWGLNNNGQLGTGTNRNHLVPTRILDDMSYVSVGGDLMGQVLQAHTLAIMSDGSLWAWGSNVYRQIGDGSTTFFHRSPVQIINICND